MIEYSENYIGIIESYIKGGTIQRVKIFFANNPNEYKYSRKISQIAHSFIKVEENIHLVCNGRFQQGDYGYVKKIINIDTQKMLILKITVRDTNESSDWKQVWEQYKSFLIKYFPESYYGFFENFKSTYTNFGFKLTVFENRFTDNKTHNEINDKENVFSLFDSPKSLNSSYNSQTVSPKKTSLNSTATSSPQSVKLSHKSLKRTSLSRSKQKSDSLMETLNFNTEQIKTLRLIDLLKLDTEENNKDDVSSCSRTINFSEESRALDSYWYKNTKDPKGFLSKYNVKLGLVMKYINGENLKFFLQENKLKDFDKLRLLLSIFEKLKEIHNKRIIHNDLHSGNILIEHNKKDDIFIIEFIDYDLAVPLLEEEIVVSSTNNRDGSDRLPNAPEQFSASKIDELHFTQEHKGHPLAAYCEQINEIAFNNKGFSSKYSDIFKLGKTLSNHFRFNDSEDNQEFLQELINNMTESNPFDRVPLEKLINKCIYRLECLRKDKQMRM